MLGVLERGTGVLEGVADAALEQARPAQEGEELGRTARGLRRPPRAPLAPARDRGQVGAPRPREREEHVARCDSGRRLGQQLVEDRRGPFTVAGEAMRLGRREAPSPPRRRIAGGRQLRRDLAELRRRRRRAAAERAACRLVKGRGDGRVRALSAASARCRARSSSSPTTAARRAWASRRRHGGASS